MKSKISFDEYYQNIYRDQWDEIKTGLLQDEKKIIRACFNAPPPPTTKKLNNHPLHSPETKGIDFNKNHAGLKSYYIMDLASLICAHTLPVNPSDDVLDMCAAPGGKSLILMEKLTKGSLWVNELSAKRRDRLKQVIRDYIPKLERERIFIKGKDATRYGIKHPTSFDAILLDAPCSSERHILKSQTELAKWTANRPKKLAALQYNLLCSALLAVREGGFILYSTCSISPQENDGVIEKILQKKGDSISVCQHQDIEYFDRTTYGYMALPHRHQIGPIYMCLLQRRRNP